MSPSWPTYGPSPSRPSAALASASAPPLCGLSRLTELPLLTFTAGLAPVRGRRPPSRAPGPAPAAGVGAVRELERRTPSEPVGRPVDVGRRELAARAMISELPVHLRGSPRCLVGQGRRSRRVTSLPVLFGESSCRHRRPAWSVSKPGLPRHRGGRVGRGRVAAGGRHGSATPPNGRTSSSTPPTTTTPMATPAVSGASAAGLRRRCFEATRTSWRRRYGGGTSPTRVTEHLGAAACSSISSSTSPSRSRRRSQVVEHVPQLRPQRPARARSGSSRCPRCTAAPSPPRRRRVPRGTAAPAPPAGAGGTFLQPVEQRVPGGDRVVDPGRGRRGARAASSVCRSRRHGRRDSSIDARTTVLRT